MTFLCAGLGAATSAIRHVELYPSGATVTREVLLQPESAGSLEVEMADLPTNLIASSVQIAAPDSQVVIGGFTFLPNENRVEDDDERTADLRGKLKVLDQSIREQQQMLAAVEQRIRFHEGLADQIRASLEEAATESAYNLALQAYGKTEAVRLEGEAESIAIREDLDKLQRERKDVQKDLNELVAELNRRTGVLKFDLAGLGTTETRLLVAYQVREANWAPVHELRASPADGTLQWVYKAELRQNTGEDWTGVTVSLNSASAFHASGLPQLDPLYLERLEGRLYQKSMGRAAVMEVEMMAADAAPAPSGVPSSTTTGFYIRLAEPVSLKTGDPAIRRTALTATLEADFWSEAVPELSTDAWLMAGMTNEIGFPILGGELFCYIDGQLVSRQGTSGIPVGEEIEMALGRNEKIVIERKERLRKESTGGLIDKTKRHDIKYETTVTNRMPVAHRVVLQDRFPVGRDVKIQVRTESPKDVEPEEGTGLFKWERTLAPAASETMVTEYAVIYPADWSVVPPL